MTDDELKKYEELKEYVGILFDLEKNLYFQEEALSFLKAKKESISQEYEQMKPREPEKPPMPKLLSEKSEFTFSLSKSTYIKDVLVGIFFSILAGVLYGLILTFLVLIVVMFFTIFAVVLSDSTLFIIFLVTGGACTIGHFLFFLYEMVRDHSKLTKEKGEYYQEKKRYEWNLSNYNLAVKKYKKETECFEAKMRDEMDPIMKVLDEDIDRMQRKRSQTKAVLESGYRLGIISQEYRGFIPVSSFYQYLNSGRCYSLQGPDGAYNKYEEEKRMAIIITHLSEIGGTLHEMNENVKKIRENQFMLYSAIRENTQSLQCIESDIAKMSDKIKEGFSGVTPTLDNIDSRLEEIQRNSAVSAYSDLQSEKELRYMNRVNYYSGRNDDAGFWHKTPPSP